jgi:hypothetical protein
MLGAVSPPLGPSAKGARDVLPSTLHDLRYRPYLRLTATIFAALGMIVGLVGLLASLVGADVFIRLLPLLHVEGVAAGLLGLVAMPIFFALLGVLIGGLTYLPFRWLLRLQTPLAARREPGGPRSE